MPEQATIEPEETRDDSPRVEIVSEPLTYERRSPTSYLRDLALSEHDGDIGATSRLKRHAEEMEVELAARERRAAAVTRDHGVEYRANPSSITSTFAPPLWVIEDFATAPGAKRVLADLVEKFPLPRGAHSINLPRLTTGATVQPQQDGAPVSDTDIVDTSSQSIVTTLVGQADSSLQLLEQSPPGAHLDFALFKSMKEGYDAQLELQLLNGSGTGENLQGVLAGALTANKIAYTDASPTGAELVPFLGQAFAAVGDNRDVPPECFLMRTARWAWLATQTSTGGNPLLLADWGQDGQGIMSLRTYWDDAIPTTLGAGGNQDAIFCVRPSDIMLWESASTTSVMFEVLSGTLQARFQLHGSAAAIIRYPSGQSTVTGTGLIVQSGY